MKKRIRIQIIGNYLNQIRFSLNRAGIYTEDTLVNGNPLGFVSLSDEDKKDMEFPEAIQTVNNVVTQLTIRKNLDEYLAHDENVFNSNIIKPFLAKTVRYKNTSSYVIVCNTNLVYPLLLFRGSLYSDTFPKNEFSEYLHREGAINIIPSVRFDQIKNYYDKYIEILLKEYDSNHILLIKTVPSLWYLENGIFKLFDDNIIKLRNFINEADSYFIEKTHCAVVNTFERFVPDGLLKESFLPCAFYPDFAYDELSADIISVIRDIENGTFSIDGEAERKELTQAGLHNAKEEEFLHFLMEKNEDGSNVSLKDIIYVEQYTESNYVDMDVLIGIFMLTKQAILPDYFSRIALNLLHNKCCSVASQSLRRYNNNKEFLSHYSYFQGDIPEISGFYIRLNNRYIIGVLPEQSVPFQLIQFHNKDTVDEKQVMDNGFCCSIHEAEALCRSMAFYVQRAKHGKGNHPVKLRCESEESFVQSLFVLDYAYLLGNEPFLIGIEDIAAKNFRVRTNLEFLFSEYVRIVRICNGLSDQITQYFLSKCIQSEGMVVYYDDLHARSINAQHQGYELDKVIIENIDDKCFSRILSDELVKILDNHEMDLPDILFEAGVYQLLAVTDMRIYYNSYKRCSRILYTRYSDYEFENLKYFVQGFGPNITHYYTAIKPELLMLYYSISLNQLCKFPRFEDEVNSRLQKEMDHCTTVGVHIRKGDYILWGETNCSFYKEAIGKVLRFPEYSDAKIYVFSDDIPWCRENAETLGLLQIDREKLTYVSHNKGDDSFRDMQLLSLCRVIIGQQGSFARMAYLLSEKCEIYLTPNKKICERFRRIGRGNKYDIELL
jgi:hypothetical protein